MASPQIIEIPRILLQVLNNLYEMERKLSSHGDAAKVQRNIDRLKDGLKEEQLFYEDPMGQPFNETRTDLEASISGTSIEKLVVVEVIKPIIRFGSDAYSKVIQKGIVVVKSS